MLVGEGSTQIRPNHALDVHVCVEAVDNVEVDVGGMVVVGFVVGAGTEVVVTVGAGWAFAVVVVVGSMQFPNHPYVEQVAVVVVFEVVDVVADVVVVSSAQPNQPGCRS